MPVYEVQGSHNIQDFSLSQPVLEALWRAEDRHFWFSARNNWLADFLVAFGEPAPRRLLEVGCGSGAVARALEALGYLVTGVDTEGRLIRKASTRCIRSNLVLGDVSHLPPDLQTPYEVVAFFDVLEHLESPEELLRSALRWAKPGALVVATVPASPELYSAVDAASGHKRRYELGELASVFARAGLVDVSEHGIFRCLSPVLKYQRDRLARAHGPGEALTTTEELLCENLKVPKFPLNSLMKIACEVERRFLRSFSRGKAGATLLVSGRCPAS